MSTAATIDFNEQVQGFLAKLSPTLVQVAADHDAQTNPDLDAVLDQFDADEAAAQRIADAELLTRVVADFKAAAAKAENAFATVGVPVIDAGAPFFEQWAIPILASFASPAFAPFVSAGLLVACKVGVAALDHWKANRPQGG